MLKAVPATVAALLAIAQNLVAEHQFDAEQALRLLAALPTKDIDVQTHGAIRHAQLVTTAAQGPSTSRDAVARFALHRVVVLLEAHLVGLGIH